MSSTETDIIKCKSHSTSDTCIRNTTAQSKLSYPTISLNTSCPHICLMYCKIQYTKLRHDDMEFFCLSRPNLPRYHHIADNYRNRGASSVPNFCICCCLSFVYGVFLLIRRCGYLKKQQVLFYLYFFLLFLQRPLLLFPC